MTTKTAKDFSRNDIYKIATDYANTSAEYSYQYFCREYEISKGTFYTVLEKAVIENIVDSNTVIAMAKKAKSNSENKAGKRCGNRSQKHYEYLIQKRRIYMLGKKESVEWTEKYAQSNLDKLGFCSKNHITRQLLDRTILKATIDNWISDEIFNLLKQKSLKKNSTAKVLEFWEKLESFRQGNKQN